MSDIPTTTRGSDGRLYTRVSVAAEAAGFSLSYTHVLYEKGRVQGLKRGRYLYVLQADVHRVNRERPLPKVKQGLAWLNAHPDAVFERIDDFRAALRKAGIEMNWGQAKSALGRAKRLLPRRGVRLAGWLEADAARRLLPWPILRQQAELALGFPVSEHAIRYAVARFDERHGKPARPGPEWITYEEAQELLAERKLVKRDARPAKRATVLRNARQGGVPMKKVGKRLYFLRPALLEHLAARGYGTKERAIRAWFEAHPAALTTRGLKDVARRLGVSYATLWKVANLMRQEGEACAD